MTYTAVEIAKKLRVPVETARALVKFLEGAKLARFVGERPGENGQRGMHCYEVDAKAPSRVSKMVEKICT